MTNWKIEKRSLQELKGYDRKTEKQHIYIKMF